MNEALVAVAKRRFLGLAFHPSGDSVAAALGMVRESDDVARARMVDECRQTSAAHTALLNILTMASWYIDALSTLSDPSIQDIPLSEHLYAFAAAVHMSGLAEPESELIP